MARLSFFVPVAKFVVLVLAFCSVVATARAEVDASGAYQTNLPIEVPAYHGLEPRIALAYNSNAGNGFGGVGWQLQGGSTIVRVSTHHGPPRFDSSDIYLLDGRAAPCLGQHARRALPR